MNLINACKRNDVKEVTRLLASKTYNQKNLDEAFGWVCYGGNIQLVKLLVEHGADITSINIKSIEMINSYEQHTEIIEYLAKKLLKRKLDEFS
jgi:ankyrin repeat protein